MEHQLPRPVRDYIVALTDDYSGLNDFLIEPNSMRLEQAAKLRQELVAAAVAQLAIGRDPLAMTREELLPGFDPESWKPDNNPQLEALLPG